MTIGVLAPHNRRICKGLRCLFLIGLKKVSRSVLKKENVRVNAVKIDFLRTPFSLRTYFNYYKHIIVFRKYSIKFGIYYGLSRQF